MSSATYVTISGVYTHVFLYIRQKLNLCIVRHTPGHERRNRKMNVNGKKMKIKSLKQPGIYSQISYFKIAFNSSWDAL